jgi:hypothetical protein
MALHTPKIQIVQAFGSLPSDAGQPDRKDWGKAEELKSASGVSRKLRLLSKRPQEQW